MEKLKPCPFCGGKVRVTKGFCRWVNQKAVFKTVSWNEYRRNVKGEKQ